MEDFIKIPKDFKSLHDLGDLISNFELTNRLMTALNDYQMAYVNSRMLTGEELLKTIPKRDHSKFTLMCREKLFESARGVYINDIEDKGKIVQSHNDSHEMQKLIKRHSKKMVELAVPGKESWQGHTINDMDLTTYFNTEINTLTRRIKRIDAVGNNKTCKMYLPNFETKKIQVCYWVGSIADLATIAKLDVKILKAKKAYQRARISAGVSACWPEQRKIDEAKKEKESSIQAIPSDGRGELKYQLDAMSFIVETDVNKLRLVVPFSFTDTYTVGGVWIGTGGGGRYLSGGTSTPYRRMGKDFYTFCTRTNKFTGFFSELEEGRGWVKGGW